MSHNLYIQGEINLRKAVIATDGKSAGRKQFHITVHGKHIQQVQNYLMLTESIVTSTIELVTL